MAAYSHAETLAALRTKAAPMHGTHAGWGIVALDDAKPAGMGRRQLGVHLASLTALGAFRDIDASGMFGCVKLEG